MRIDIQDFKEHNDCGVWRSYDLETHGDTLEECLTNNWIYEIDQDGGCIASYKGLCAESERAITRYFEANIGHIRRTYNVSKLGHMFKIPAPLVEELARQLHAAGFIDTIGNDRFAWTDKESKSEMFKVVSKVAALSASTGKGE